MNVDVGQDLANRRWFFKVRDQQGDLVKVSYPRYTTAKSAHKWGRKWVERHYGRTLEEEQGNPQEVDGEDTFRL